MSKIWQLMKVAAGGFVCAGLLWVWFVDPWQACKLAFVAGLIAGVCDAVAS